MHAQASLRPFRTISAILAALVLTACGQGKGPDSVPGTLVPPPEPCDSITFESDCPTPDIVNFNGGATVLVDNPDQSDINPSDRVARMQKFPDRVFGGTKLVQDEAIDFSQGEFYKVKVWSPRPVAVTFKLEEEGNPETGGLAKVQDHPGGSAWQELCFDFTGQNVPPPVISLTIIFDDGTLGQADTDPANWTFYYDDITQVESCAEGPGASIIPDAALYATDADPDLVIPDDYAERTAFGSGSVIDPLYADDEAFSPVLSVFSGTDYGANVAQVGFIGFQPGFLRRYETVDFKVKGMPNFVILVKLFDGVDALRLNLTSSEFSTELGDGWYQVSIPVSRFSDAELGTGIVFESDNTAPTQFRMLLTDVGFSGTGDFVPADPGILPDVTLYDRDGTPDLEPGVDYGDISAFDSGADIQAFTDDLDFSPALSVTTGFGYGIWNAQFAYVGFEPGFATAYETLDFKVKDLSGDVIRVKLLPEPVYVDVNVTSSPYATELGNGWYQVSVPIADIPGADLGDGLLFETVSPPPDESFTYLITDIGFSGEGPVDTTTSVDFEGDPGSYSFENFGGGVSTVIANPDQSGINTSGQVVQMTRTSESNFGGSTLALPEDVDWSQGDIFRMKVWSPRPVDVTFKIEGSTTPERPGNHDGGGVWQELCFDFTGDNAGAPVTGISIFFDLGVTPPADDPDNWTFYYDDIVQSSEGCPVDTPTSVDFEGDPSAFDFGPDGGFGGGVSTVIENPVPDGINTSGQVVQMQKFSVADFGGSTLALPEGVDWSQGEIFRMKVWSQRSVPVRFKVEGDPAKERDDSHTGGSQWQELCFDFTGDTAGQPVTGISIFFDLGVVGDAENDPDNWTFYYDDIEQSSEGCPVEVPLGPVDFEPEGLGQAFAWTVFENADNPAVAVIANPDASGANTSANVAEFTARVGGQPFAGAVTLDLPTFTLEASNSCVKIKVWKPVVSDVGIKFETGTGASTGEIRVANTVTSQWEELTFDFSGKIGEPESTDIAGFVLFPDFDARTQDNIVYFDDVQFLDQSQCGGDAALGPVDFEPDGLGQAFAWSVFENADNPGVAVIANPDASGANTSANVAEFTARVGGQPFAGAVTSDLPTFTLDASNSCVKIKVWKPVLSDVGIKFETGTQASTGEIKVANTVANQWEELTFDFSGKIGEPESTDIAAFVLFPDFDARTQDNTVYFDDIEFLDQSQCGGGEAAIGPVDFEPDGLGQAFAWTVFENVDNPAVAVIANPDASGANTSANVAEFTARVGGQPFAGAVTSDLPTFTLEASNSCLKIKVWKPVVSDVGIKFETGTQASTGEIKVANTVTNQWEELTFDFSGKIGEPESTDITGFVLFPDFDARTQDNVIYFDDIVFVDGGQCP